MPDTIAEVEKRLAARHDGMRAKCPWHSLPWAGQSGGVNRDGLNHQGCPKCHGLGYIPAVTLDGLLRVCRSMKWPVTFDWLSAEDTEDGETECCLATVLNNVVSPISDNPNGFERGEHAEAEAPDEREALARALDAADSQG